MADYQPHSHVPYGADGSGFYSDNTIGCYNVVRAATPTVLSAIDDIIFTKGDTFVVCDYGTADGGTSMFLIRDIVEKVKEKFGDDQEVSIIYEDQPVNDFKSIFLRLNGMMPGPPSYLATHSGVYVSACGTGFYSQCVPTNSVHLGFSCTAMHWLSKRPCGLTDVIHHTLSSNAAEKDKFSAQAALDWETILLHRAKELAPGGQLMLVNFCVDADGNLLGKSPYLPKQMYVTLNNCWTDMWRQGRISETEYQKACLNNYYRTEAEVAAPLTDKQSPVYKAGLRLVSMTTRIVRCPYHEKWVNETFKEATDLKVAARRHAAWYVPTTRTWSNYSFLSALGDDRTEDDKNVIVDEFYQRYEDEVAAAPGDHGMDYCHTYLSIRKES